MPSRLRVLFLCTRNAARSQIAEAVLAHKSAHQHPVRFEVASAGASPGDAVHPQALDVLRDHGIDWKDRRPKSIDSVHDQAWDLIITVCDRAREACPVFPGQPIFAHWGMEDPSDVAGTDAARARAFYETYLVLSRRIDLLLALPFESLERAALERKVRSIAAAATAAEPSV